MVRGRTQLWMIVLALAVLVALLAPDTRAAGRSLVVQMDEPFEVNGQLYPAGELTLRELSQYNPVATLNEVLVDGQTLGYVVTRENPGSSDARRDELTFIRGGHGHLVLSSVALKGQPDRRLVTPAAEKGSQLRALDSVSEPDSLDDAEVTH